MQIKQKALMDSLVKFKKKHVHHNYVIFILV